MAGLIGDLAKLVLAVIGGLTTLAAVLLALLFLALIGGLASWLS